MPTREGNIEFFFGPSELGAPDDLRATIVGFIDAAREELLVAVQELEDEPIARALVAARVRGVRVRVILERSYLREDTAQAQPFAPGGANEANRQLLAGLLRAGIDVAVDLNPKIFHQKFVVRDPGRTAPQAAVLTGSTNFTPTGVGANLNLVAVVMWKKVAGDYAAEFEEMWSGTFGLLAERRDTTTGRDGAPPERRVRGVPVKVLFAPDHGPEMEIMKQMMKARERVDFAIFTFSRSSGIDDTLKLLARSGIAVRGVLDASNANQAWAASHALLDDRSGRIELSVARHRDGLNKLHHKLVVIDGRVRILGSFNFTGPANRLNDENILVVGRPDAEARGSPPGGSLARAALAEIDRIIDRFGEPLTRDTRGLEAAEPPQTTGIRPGPFRGGDVVVS
jgi:phosphatidylserine/phosphatidylglycerophosphate/cardiolipin synthase-like enzyme